MKSPLYNERGTVLVIELVVLAVVLVAAGFAFYNYNQRKNATNPAASPVPRTTQTVSLSSYEHPELHYTLQYPSTWQLDGSLINPAPAERDKNFAIKTSDYREASMGVPELEAGASISIQALNTTETSIDKEFNRDELRVRLAKNIAKTEVDGQDAIQYDWQYEWHKSTTTILLKNGKSYLITLRYPDTKDKSTHLPAYQQVLDSFKAK